MDQQINCLLDKSIPFDMDKVKILDQVIDAMYGKNVEHIQLANKILSELKEDPQLWVYSDIIIDCSQTMNTKMYALLVLDEAIKTRWNILPGDQKEAIKKYIVQFICKVATVPHSKEHSLLAVANKVLIQIVKYEWSTTWKNFIPEICNACKTNQYICENNLNLLKMLSDEIIEYSKNQMTTKQRQELKNHMYQEFTSIYELCYFICKSYIENNEQVRPALLRACLETLQTFLSWIPLAYIFCTDLIENILMFFLNQPLFRINALKCLNEIAILKADEGSEEENQQIRSKAFQMLGGVVQTIGNVIPIEISLIAERKKIEQNVPQQLQTFENLCQQLSLFLTGFFMTNLEWLEPQTKMNQQQKFIMIELIQKGLMYVARLSELPEEQNFKICVEYWHWFTNYLISTQNQNVYGNNEPILFLNNGENTNLRQSVYPIVLTQVRKIMIGRMAKPQEVLIVIDDNGYPVREVMQNTENNALYEVMKELMVNLSKLDWENMYTILKNKLEAQLDGTEWSFDNLNTLCWAIGCIGGTLPETDEKHFVISTIRLLLNLVEQRKGKENKAVVASNIMYIVGQYPRFLRANWNFLKTVVKKLFEFMHEPFPGVMEMSCNTFLKISQQCKEEFVIIHKPDELAPNRQIETEPYLNEIIRRLPQETNMLEPQLKLIFYESVGHLISAVQDPKDVEVLLTNTLQDLWNTWGEIIENAKSNNDLLKNDECLVTLSFILKAHERLAFAVKHPFFTALAKIYIEMINLYMFYSEFLSSQVLAHGKNILFDHILKKMKAVRKDTIKLIQTYIEGSNDPQFVASNFVVPMLNILQDYANSVNETKEETVILLFSTVLSKLASAAGEFIPKILELIFESTIGMISHDFNSYPDHRLNFFEFLKSATTNCLEAVFSVPEAQFKILMDCVIWALKHEHPTFHEMGLDILTVILKNVNTNQMIANQFYSYYYISILNDVLTVTTNSTYKNSFKQHATILNLLVSVVNSGFLTAPVSENQNANNKEFVYNHLCTWLSGFETITKTQTEQYVTLLFQTCDKPHDFKVALRDYLINLTQFSGDAEAFPIDDKVQKSQGGGDMMS